MKPKQLVKKLVQRLKIKNSSFSETKNRRSQHLFLNSLNLFFQDEFEEPRLDPQGLKIVVIGPSPNDLVSKVFSTKLNKKGNTDRARAVELINEFDNKLDKDPL